MYPSLSSLPSPPLPSPLITQLPSRSPLPPSPPPFPPYLSPWTEATDQAFIYTEDDLDRAGEGSDGGGGGGGGGKWGRSSFSQADLDRIVEEMKDYPDPNIQIATIEDQG